MCCVFCSVYAISFSHQTPILETPTVCSVLQCVACVADDVPCPALTKDPCQKHPLFAVCCGMLRLLQWVCRVLLPPRTYFLETPTLLQCFTMCCVCCSVNAVSFSHQRPILGTPTLLQCFSMCCVCCSAYNVFFSHQGHILETPKGTPLPKMMWPSNHIKLATGTMFTLFFAGNDFAPNLKIDGQSAQDFLQV